MDDRGTGAQTQADGWFRTHRRRPSYDAWGAHERRQLLPAVDPLGPGPRACVGPREPVRRDEGGSQTPDRQNDLHLRQAEGRGAGAARASGGGEAQKEPSGGAVLQGSAQGEARPERPGRRKGEGSFSNLGSPSVDEITDHEDVKVSDSACRTAVASLRPTAMMTNSCLNSPSRSAGPNATGWGAAGAHRVGSALGPTTRMWRRTGVERRRIDTIPWFRRGDSSSTTACAPQCARCPRSLRDRRRPP